MSLHFFFISAARPQPFQDELNQFLAAHRVVAVDRRWIEAGEASGWAICVEVAHGPGPLPPGLTATGASAPTPAAVSKKVDYRELLSPEDFAVYARLRTLRNAIGERDGIPPYQIFANDQLAAMVQKRVHTRAALAALSGVGPARMERYAVEFLPPLVESFGSPVAVAPDETADA
jgi:superfamily II DNA helicase RecQ